MDVDGRKGKDNRFETSGWAVGDVMNAKGSA
jgi:hypothetical protein